MFGRTGFRFSGNTVKAFMQKIFQRPAGTVGSQHVQIVDMDVAVAVRLAHIGRVNMAQPIIGRYLAGNVQNQTAVGIPLVGIGVDSPVESFQIFVDGALNVNHNLAIRTHAVALVTIQNIGLGRGKIVGGNQNLLYDILNLFNRRHGFGKLMLQNFQNLSRQKPAFLLSELSGGKSGLVNGIVNFAAVKRGKRPIPFGNALNVYFFIGDRGHIVVWLRHFIFKSFFVASVQCFLP